jgi:PAS domain-containing protein
VLPAEIVERVMNTVALPFILTFAPATVLLGLLLEDVERRFAVESALIASEEKLSLHLENTPLAAITWDENFLCTQWNKTARETLGYSAEEAVGKHAMYPVVPVAIQG